MLFFASMLLAGIGMIVGTGPQVAGYAAAGDAIVSAPVTSPFGIISPNDGAYLNTSNIEISWAADPGADNYFVWLEMGRGSDVGTVTSYTFERVSDGEHTFSVFSFYDYVERESDSVRVIVDTMAPTLTITSPAVGAWYNTLTINVTWSASDAVSGIKNMSVSMDGGAWADVAVEYMEFSSLAEGAHSVSVRAYDNAGNYRVSTKAFNVDLTLPVLDITNPSESEEITSSSLEVTWSSTSASGAGNYWISLDSGSWTDVDLGTSYTYGGLSEGAHTVALRVESFAGNYNTTSVAFTVSTPDTVAPTVTGSPSGSSVGIGTNVVAAFSEAMNQSTVVISVNGVSGSTAWSGNVATFTPAEPLAYGTTYTVNVTGKDLAGNAMSDEWTFTTMQNAGTVTGTIKDANGNNLAGALVTLSNGMNATTDENGAFTIDNIPSGVYTMTITKDGHPTVTRELETTAGQTKDLGSVSLVSASTGGIDGTIIMVAAVALVAVIAAFLLMVGRRMKK